MNLPENNGSPTQEREFLPSFQPVENEGFPWTGLTLVLVVMGLLAFMAVPVGPLSPRQLRDQRLLSESHLALGELRAAVDAYRRDHGRTPGHDPRPSAADRFSSTWFERQLLMATDDAGHAVPSRTQVHPHGPYLTKIPNNPLNQKSTVLLVERGADDDFEPDGATGWVFFCESGTIRLNSLARPKGSSKRYYDL